jgi:hypothetical protein
MRWAAWPVLLLACFAPSSSASADTRPQVGTGGSVSVEPAPEALSASLSTHRAGAPHVRLTLTVRYEMRCNNPGPGILVVVLPKKERQPQRIAASAVTLDGRAAAKVKTRPHVVSITLPVPQGITCNVIAPGKLIVVFKPSAGLGNPAAPSVYPLTVRKGDLALETSFRIR